MYIIARNNLRSSLKNIYTDLERTLDEFGAFNLVNEKLLSDKL